MKLRWCQKGLGDIGQNGMKKCSCKSILFIITINAKLSFQCVNADFWFWVKVVESRQLFVVFKLFVKGITKTRWKDTARWTGYFRRWDKKWCEWLDKTKVTKDAMRQNQGEKKLRQKWRKVLMKVTEKTLWDRNDAKIFNNTNDSNKTM